MKTQNIKEAKFEAKRFLKKIKDFEDIGSSNQSKESGALKRSSMDLTRALSKMRNDIY